ncbi:MAG: class I SAM-dependent methyltransferase [Actinomycetota bacterium]|nr:class I SAM-dependent methyltransferase [Actinomycetota bacterium]
MDSVDLDQLASAYAYRPPSVSSIERAERAGLLLAPGSRVLDVGGGPGNHSAVWARQGHDAVLLDPSMTMLTGVSERGLTGVRATAQAMPFLSRCFSLVWFHLSIHYGDWRVSVDEALRVMTDAGRVEIWTLGSDHYEHSFLTRWFPSVAIIDADRFPDPAVLAAYLEDRVRSISITHPIETVTKTAGAWIPAIEAGFVSTLQLVPADERARGIEAIRRRYPDPSEEIAYELRFTRIVADGASTQPPHPQGS